MKPEQIHPRGDRVFVRLDAKPATSQGGIILPDDIRTRQQERFGRILRIGPDTPKDLRVGQRVALNFFTGTNCDAKVHGLPEGEYKFLEAKDVLANVDD